MKEKLKDMLSKRPEELEGETLKLFEAIMKIADERDELRVRNKELEEENIYLKQKGIRQLERYTKYHNTQIENFNNILDDFIPKSKIKEKIEELNREEQEAQNSISDEEREEYSDANISYILMDIETRRRCYKELLGE